MKRQRFLKTALTVWGWICLIWAVLYVALSVWAAGGHGIFYPGTTGLGEWIGMGLISFGLAETLPPLDDAPPEVPADSAPPGIPLDHGKPDEQFLARYLAGKRTDHTPEG